ncbi:conserved hypothetical protein [Streptomyces clavuligerus]|nr:conserved hypothetical protein [Streptomyces clavuligerus]
MYGAEVPAYTTLVEVAHGINREVAARDGHSGRLGGIERVTAERHGAIRVGTPHELRQAAQIFAALGMRPVGFYDLREAAASSVPVVSTAFRPLDADELERNPFRVFTSMLTTADRRFFDADLERRLGTFLGRRELFPPELLELAGRAERDGGLEDGPAERFLTLAVAAFELSPEPVDRAWYGELERVSSVAADIGGVSRTHVNHLTPRVLDIDELYRRMTERGVTMIDRIQGPPRWAGPDVLLRQTSFRALAEPRRFREADGSVRAGTLRVRFGEVEARGIALTRAGRARYDELIGEPATVWEGRFPATERDLALEGFGFFRFQAAEPRVGTGPCADGAPRDLRGLLDSGLLTTHPIVYEDFLPRSAAGIFQSNLTDEGTRDTSADGTPHDLDWLSGVLERPVYDPFALYEEEQRRSLRDACAAIGRQDLGQQDLVRQDREDLDPSPS